MPRRRADARWDGSLEEGTGTMRMATGSYEGPYSFQSRFEEGEGTNPEELIAAAHAACFSMALSHGLTGAGTPPSSIDTKAEVSFQAGVGITGVHLTVRANVPGLSNDDFVKAAENAKANCPVSKALAAVENITLDAALV